MRHLLLVLFFLPALSVYAQEEAPKSGRTCRIIFPERPNNSPKFAFLYDGKKNQRVFLPSMNFSEVMTFPKGELTLMMVAEEIKDPENLPVGAPVLKIPETVREFYILVTPDPKNKQLPLKMNLVNAGDGKLKPGKTLWFNLTKHRILGELGESNMVVEPKGWTVTDGPMAKSGYYRADLRYQYEGKGKLLRITEQKWWYDVRSRHLGFIVPTGGRLPKIFYFRDFRL